MSAHWLLAVGFAGMAVAIFFLGWSARIMRVEWRDDKALRAAEARYERHTHRKGDPLPTAGRIPLERLADPELLPGEPPWLFAGEQDPGWAAEAAEYERPRQPEDRGHFTGVGANTTWHPSTTPEPPAVGSLDWTVQRLVEVRADERAASTAELPASSVEGEPPIDTGEILAMTAKVEGWIAEWVAQSNYDQHTMRAD